MLTLNSLFYLYNQSHIGLEYTFVTIQFFGSNCLWMSTTNEVDFCEIQIYL